MAIPVCGICKKRGASVVYEETEGEEGWRRRYTCRLRTHTHTHTQNKSSVVIKGATRRAWRACIKKVTNPRKEQQAKGIKRNIIKLSEVKTRKPSNKH